MLQLVTNVKHAFNRCLPNVVKADHARLFVKVWLLAGGHDTAEPL